MNSVETSNNNNIVVIDMVDGDASNTPTTAMAAGNSGNTEQTANGVKENMCLVDIPMPGKHNLTTKTRNKSHLFRNGPGLSMVSARFQSNRFYK